MRRSADERGVPGRDVGGEPDRGWLQKSREVVEVAVGLVEERRPLAALLLDPLAGEPPRGEVEGVPDVVLLAEPRIALRRRLEVAVQPGRAALLAADAEEEGAGHARDPRRLRGLKERRYCCGLTPRERVKWWRSVAALPKPTSEAIHSTERSVCSSSSSARSTRCWVTHECGVAPVSARNRRANVRGDISDLRARVSTSRSSSRWPMIHWSRGPNVSLSQSGTARSMNWAWPPSRCGGTTIRRAAVAATRAP